MENFALSECDAVKGCYTSLFTRSTEGCRSWKCTNEGKQALSCKFLKPLLKPEPGVQFRLPFDFEGANNKDWFVSGEYEMINIGKDRKGKDEYSLQL
jgi:hypothetical protein